MTRSYDLFFCVLWAPAVLALPAIAATLIVAIAFAREPATQLALGALCLVLLVYTVVLRLHDFRVRVRAGVGCIPFIFSGDSAPRDEVRLRQFVADCVRRNGRPPSVVGGGWGYFLYRRGPRAPRLFTHNFKGKHPTKPGRWLAGTTIAAVNSDFKKSGRTLAHVPTMQYIAIGSWASRSNHGNYGDAAPEIAEVILSVTLLNMPSNTTRTMGYNDCIRLFESGDGDSYMVLDVEFASVADIMVQKRGTIIKDAGSAAVWLAPGAKLRMAFLGAARDYAVGLRWENVYDDSDHYDPHFGSRFGTFMQVDVCSVCCGCHEPMEKFGGKTLLSDANKWTPAIFPIMNLLLIATGLRNFELLVPIGVLEASKFADICRDLIALHRRLGGRSELRYGKTRADSILYIDLSLSRGFADVFKLMYTKYGVKRLALHPGKYNDIDTSPCERVGVSELARAGP